MLSLLSPTKLKLLRELGLDLKSFMSLPRGVLIKLFKQLHFLPEEMSIKIKMEALLILLKHGVEIEPEIVTELTNDFLVTSVATISELKLKCAYLDLIRNNWIDVAKINLTHCQYQLGQFFNTLEISSLSERNKHWLLTKFNLMTQLFADVFVVERVSSAGLWPKVFLLSLQEKRTEIAEELFLRLFVWTKMSEAVPPMLQYYFHNALFKRAREFFRDHSITGTADSYRVYPCFFSPAVGGDVYAQDDCLNKYAGAKEVRVDLAGRLSSQRIYDYI